MGGKQMSAGQKKWGDRAFGNTMEHFPLFNMALWLHAVYVSPAVATNLGIAYLCLVVAYPVIWALIGGEDGAPFKPYSLMPLFGPLTQIYYSTFPRYGIVVSAVTPGFQIGRSRPHCLRHVSCQSGVCPKYFSRTPIVSISHDACLLVLALSSI